ncbi:MAG: family 10 glycosylhydrolase [Lachnospiraceae bacterium]|nr:family 10 glycosylhydrolase [Lachnospiraceae bacterium]
MKTRILRGIAGIIATLLIICTFSASEIPAFGKSSTKKDTEFRAVWIAYYDFNKSKGYSEEDFTTYVEEMFDNAVSFGMNAVVVHVRPFSDAMYQSDYYPWSSYASGTQGVDPGYDPLDVMIEAAHERGLQIHAWLNPYRVSNSWNYGTDVTKLAKKNPAHKWLTNSKTTDDRNVLAYGGALYYNPSKSAVRKLIINGIREIVDKYEVDGIHLDDYFYPDLDKDYKTNFDAPEYEAYAAKKKKEGKKVKTIAEWRKGNVNELVKGIYAAVKESNPNVIFGISPGGYIDYFDEEFRWYVDYRTWMSEDGYVDYICPQLYWSFNSKNIYPYYDTLLKWAAARKNPSVKLYAGLPAYKLNEKNSISSQESLIDSEFYNPFLLADMIRHGREGGADGFIVFDYEDLVKEKNATAVERMKEAW